MVEREDFLRYHLDTLKRSKLDPAARIALEGIGEEVTRLRNMNEQLAKDSLVDKLTGLGNRRSFDMRKIELERLMKAEHRRINENSPPHGVVVASVDVIDFKKFNEEHSQSVGDKVLQGIAISLSGPFRKDEWYRRGGDEFVGLMPVDDEYGIEKVLDKLRSGVPGVYNELRRQNSQLPLPEYFPVRCATQVYRIGGEYGSLDEAELAADPKTVGRNQRIFFSS